MRSLIHPLVIAALSAGFMLSARSLLAQVPAGKPSPANVVATANNAFGGDLYAQFKDQLGNIFFSPYSISSALTMTYQGAKGATAAEMAKVLHLPADNQALDNGYAALNKALHGILKEKGFELSLANALWGQTGQPFLPAFTDNLKDNYGAGLEELDFASAPEPARLKINAWVESQTHERIKDLLTRGTITSGTRLVLTNAIYFKGQWAKKFDPKLTKEGDFRTRFAGDIVKTPLMLQHEKFRYTEDEKCQALELGYAGGELALVVLLPKPIAAPEQGREIIDLLEAGRKALDQAFTGDYVAELMKKMTQREVIVTLPKWKMTHKYELNAPLQGLGMKLAFQPDADFSWMTGQTGFFLSRIIHKAFVEVNEEGTEAAAATAMVMFGAARPAEPPKPVEFKADRVFLYAIVHKPSGAILFAERVTDPTKTEGE